MAKGPRNPFSSFGNAVSGAADPLGLMPSASTPIGHTLNLLGGPGGPESVKTAGQMNDFGNPLASRGTSWDEIGLGATPALGAKGWLHGGEAINDTKSRNIGRGIGAAIGTVFGAGALAGEGGATTGGVDATGGAEAAGPALNAGSAASTEVPADSTLFGETGGTQVGTAGASGTAASAASSAGSTIGTIKDIATVLSAAGSVIGAASGLDASRKAGRAPPPVPPPVTMPSADSPITRIAQQNSIFEQIMRRGRASTILTSPSGFGG